MYLKIFSFFFIAFVVGITKSKEEKYVEISLDAKWTQTPIPLEASEYIASKSNDKFWSYISSMQSVTSSSDKESYDNALNIAKSLLSPIEMDTLKFSLSLRTYSPRVQLYQQMATNLKAGCDLFYQTGNGNVYCDLKKALDNVKVDRSENVLDVDHIHPDSESGENLLIVYADIQNEHFSNIHKQIINNIEPKNLKYVLRHHYKTTTTDKVGLSGYGVELAVKSTEYKAVDDQKVAESAKKEKSTDNDPTSDDEVEGFLFNRLRKLHPGLQDNLDQLKSHLKESNKELAPLRVWQLQDLSFQAAQRVISASSQDVLNVLSDLSQSVPMVARSLVKTPVNEEMRREIRHNQEEFQRSGISPGDARMFVNGIELDHDDLDAFKLLNIIQDETSAMSRLNNIDLDVCNLYVTFSRKKGTSQDVDVKIQPVKIGEILALNAKSEDEALIVDTRSESVQWLNDLENDQQYQYWPSNLQELLRPTFPGMMRYIAKNIFHVVAYVDPLVQDGREMLKLFNEMVGNSVPARFGFVFVADGSVKDEASENPGAALLRAFSFIKSDKGHSEAFRFLDNIYRVSGQGPVTSEHVIDLFTAWYGESEAEEQLGPDSDNDDLRRISKKVFDTIGLKSLPQVLVNGQQVTYTGFDMLENAVAEKVLAQTPPIQQAVYLGSHYGYPNIYDYLMSQPNVVTRLNKIIQKVDDHFVHANRIETEVDDLFTLNKAQSVGLLMKNVKYFVQEKGITIWVIANAQTDDGRELIKNAMKYVHAQKERISMDQMWRSTGKRVLSEDADVNIQQKQKNARVAIILHGYGTESSEVNYNDVVQLILNLRQKLISGVAKLLVKVLEDEKDVSEIIKEENIMELATGITGINKKKLVELLSSTDATKKARETIQENSLLVQKAFKLQDDEQIVMANGRINVTLRVADYDICDVPQEKGTSQDVNVKNQLLGPLKGDDVFVAEDFDLLQSFENNRCGHKISEKITECDVLLEKGTSQDVDVKNQVDSMNLPKLPTEGHDRYKSDLVFMISSILSEREDKKRGALRFSDDKHSVIHLAPRKDSISLDVEAVLDPLSKGAQKLAPILKVLHEAFNVNLRIFLNCKAKHSEMPVNRFYSYVLQPELHFDNNGKLVQDSIAVFKNLPHSALLTLIMDTSQSWMIEAVGSNQDLDNIHLGQATGAVYGYFELEHIIIEGHCSESGSQQPPRGLQFILGTESDPEMFDTIVMANLGYFQLKAFPGSFVLQLRDGRSAQIYQIDELTGGKELSNGQNYTIIIDGFSGQFLKVKVKRRPGQESADLLGGEGGDDDEMSGGIWDSIASYVKREKSTKNTDGKIHIFSVATGLLYERFLRIMMLSVLNHTKTPVKFWFLKNYLSSKFTKFLPTFAEQYGFEYELVQYQWPRWLNGQTEKQRIIWGYKILFLDVLFPLNLERIIFVDADQIVRADLNELMQMDLDGAPYAYTPFCNDRPEVEGFRFWNQGYWRNHLAGRPYHISALYVIDLKRFRRVAAGDRLRGQYQGLSQDPNSLANLDQDLPNNMIHQVQIKSLPQEWLWCETWCSDESKAKAKTIDMCNNPQTKEPKLQRAMRIAPEWSVYDEIIRELQENLANNVSTSKEKTALPIKVEL